MPNIKKSESALALSFSSEEFDQKKYTEVALCTRLVEISLVKQEYEVKLHYFWGDLQNAEKLKHGFLGKPKGYKTNSDSGLLIGGYQWKADVRHGRNKALKLSAQYMLVYRLLDDVDPAYIKLYFNKIARFTSYPYFRTLFSVCTGNSSLALDPLPSLTDRVD